DEPDIDPEKPVGELAGKPQKEDIPTVDEPDPAPVAAAKAAKAKKAKAKKDKAKKIPNFEKFRTKLFLVIAAVLLLLGGWYCASFIAPRVTVAISTDSTTANPTIEFTADADATKANLNNNTVQAKVAEKT